MGDEVSGAAPAASGGAAPVPTADQVPVVVDARGLVCPQPVIEAARRSRSLTAGALLEVWATDPAAALDLPAWCRLRGHELVTVEELSTDVPVRVVVRLR